MTRLFHAAVLVGSLAASCTSVSVDQFVAPELAPLRTMGCRIAVMPFSVSAPAEGLLTSALAPVGELIALESSAAGANGDIGTLLHDDVVAWLQQSDYEVLDPWHVATQLGHASIGADAQRDPKNAAAIARLLRVDGVLFGDVRKWNRSYYVLQSTVDVALHLELLDAAGKLLFSTDRHETIGSGLTGGPTGYVSAATEPIAGLRGSNLRQLTRSVARHAVIDLNGGDLQVQPGPAAPRLVLVALARQHEGAFRAGERVDVLAVGSPDCNVRFDLGRLRIAVPMRQTELHSSQLGPRATYAGHYVVGDGDVADELPVACTIQRGMARRTVAVRYRWDGTVSLAGGAPQ